MALFSRELKVLNLRIFTHLISETLAKAIIGAWGLTSKTAAHGPEPKSNTGSIVTVSGHKGLKRSFGERSRERCCFFLTCGNFKDIRKFKSTYFCEI